MVKRMHWAPVTKETHDEARLMDAQDNYSAHMVETTGRHSPSRLEDFAQGGRLQHFADGANYIERDTQGNDTKRNAILDAGGDPNKYVGSGWTKESIRAVEAERVRSQSDWWD